MTQTSHGEFGDFNNCLNISRFNFMKTEFFFFQTCCCWRRNISLFGFCSCSSASFTALLSILTGIGALGARWLWKMFSASNFSWYMKEGEMNNHVNNVIITFIPQTSALYKGLLHKGFRRAYNHTGADESWTEWPFKLLKYWYMICDVFVKCYNWMLINYHYHQEV